MLHSCAVLPGSKLSSTLTTFVFPSLNCSHFISVWLLIIHFLNSISNSPLSIHTSASSCRGTARSVFGESNLCVFVCTHCECYGLLFDSNRARRFFLPHTSQSCKCFQANSLLNGFTTTITSIRWKQGPRNRDITRAWQVFSPCFNYNGGGQVLTPVKLQC